MTAKIMLGWREWVELPAFGLGPIRAKVDSGARSSALHVWRHWRFTRDGAPWVGFDYHPGGDATAIQACAPVLDEREVADSGGHRTRRVFLRTPLRLGGVEREIDINLCDRGGMLFPMLLGRTAMAGAFTVDPARSFLHGRHPRPRATPGAHR